MTGFVTRQELDTALPNVLAAPRQETTVAMLCRRPARNQRDFAEKLEFSTESGVLGDYGMSSPWLTLPDGAPDPRIQVSVLPSRVLDLVWRDRENTTFPGDTIIADLSTSLEALPVGTLLQVGDAVIEVSDVWNEGCAKWKVRFGREAYDWTSAPEHEALRLRGVYCSIVKNGTVCLGDKIIRL